jgi:hypothetical protein
MTKNAPKKMFFHFILLPIFLLTMHTSALSEGGPETGAKIKIEKEWKGSQSGYTFPLKFFIETEVQWREVWDKVHRFRIPRPELPEIDFKNETALAVFMGVQKSGGYDIKISEIIKTEKAIKVIVKESKPPPDTVQTMALTQPFHIIVIEKLPLPIRFAHP